MTTISASRIGALTGCDPRLSPLGLFLMLSGQMPDDYDERDKDYMEREFTDEAIESGIVFEPAVRDLICKKYKLKAVDGPKHLTHEKHPITGHPDAYVVDQDGKLAILELKFIWHGDPDKWGPELSDQVPTQYFMQALTYAMLLRDCEGPDCFVPNWPIADYAYLGAWIAGVGLRLYKVPLDPEIEKRTVQEVYAMVQRVENNNPPTPLDEADCRMRWFVRDNDSVVEATVEEAWLLAELQELSQKRKECEKAESQLKHILLSVFQDKALMVIEHQGVKYTVASAKARESFDKGLFQQRYPEAAALCMTLDTTKARKEHKAAYEDCKHLPETISEQARVLRIRKDLNTLMDVLIPNKGD